MNEKINICGVVYTITQTTRQFDSDLYADLGYCEFSTKRIVIRKNLDVARKQSVLRHELMHAFFNECGLENYSEDETLVTFLEYQLPKIFELCKNTNTL